MVRRPSSDPDLMCAVQAALEKKAEEVTVLDLRGLSDATDYFLICHGRSGRQAQTIADHIEQTLRSRRRRPGHVEGHARGEWILMDYYDFVVHIFTAERRIFYALERLWGDAPRIPVRRPAARRRRGAGEGAEGEGAGAEGAAEGG